MNALASRINLTKASSEAFTDEQMFYIISALTGEISRLDNPNTDQLVSAILRIKWFTKDRVFINSYVRFLTVLVSGVPRWWSDVTRNMVKGFITEENTETHHNVIKHVLKLMPTIVSSFQTILSENFPHKSESKQQSMRYITNILRVVDYVPELRSSVWSLIFEHIIQLDVELQDLMNYSDEEDEEDDEDNEEEEDDSDSDSDSDEEMSTPPSAENNGLSPRMRYHDEGSDDDGVLDVSKIQTSAHADGTTRSGEDDLDESQNGKNDDDDDDEVRGVATLFDDEDDGEYIMDNGIDVRAIRDKLDSIMVLLFKYIDAKLNSDTLLEQNGEAQVLFLTLLAHFKSFVLSTHRTRSVQFLLFKATHSHPELIDGFLASLIEIAIAPQEVMDRRLKSMQYISSFVARAKGLSRTQLIFAVSILTEWLNRYVQEREVEVDGLPGGMGRFKMFYAVSQALMYIFCFRHDMLHVQSDDNQSKSNGTRDSEWECSLDKMFQRIVISKFNPLRYCRDTVVSKFAQIAHRENLVYCFTIMEQNRLGPKQAASLASSNNGNPYLSSNISDSSNKRPQASLSSSFAKYMFHNARHKDFVMLEAYFPFDPLFLPICKKVISPIYVEWVQDEEDSESEEVDDDDDNDADDDNDEVSDVDGEMEEDEEHIVDDEASDSDSDSDDE